MTTIGFRIKSLRQNRKMSQKDFAERVCISQSYLSRIESDKEQPTDMLLKLIALEINCSLVWLESGDGSMELNENEFDYWDRSESEKIKIAAIYDILELIEKTRQNQEAVISRSISVIIPVLNYILGLQNPKKSAIILDELSEIVNAFNYVVEEYEKNGLDNDFPGGLSVASKTIEKDLRALYSIQTD